jgi:hypothetical protein
MERSMSIPSQLFNNCAKKSLAFLPLRTMAIRPEHLKSYLYTNPLVTWNNKRSCNRSRALDRVNSKLPKNSKMASSVGAKTVQFPSDKEPSSSAKATASQRIDKKSVEQASSAVNETNKKDPKIRISVIHS